MKNKVINIDKYIKKRDIKSSNNKKNYKNNLISLDNYRKTVSNNNNNNNRADEIIKLLKENSKRMDSLNNIDYPDIISPDKDIYNKIKEISIYEDIYDNIYSYIYPIYKDIESNAKIKTVIIKDKESGIFINSGLYIQNKLNWSVSSEISITNTTPLDYFYKEIITTLITRLMLEYIYSKTSLKKYESPENLSISGIYSGSISISSSNSNRSVITKTILNMVIIDILNKDFKMTNRVSDAFNNNDNIINITHIDNNEDISVINNIKYNNNLEKTIMINAYSDIRSDNYEG